MVLCSLFQQWLSERRYAIEEKNSNWNLQIKVWNMAYRQDIAILNINKNLEGLFGFDQHKRTRITIILKVSMVRLIPISLASEDATISARCTL